jgi:hypothetical protein
MPAIPPHLIEELASDDEFARTLAAEEIHRIGRTPALRVVKAWQANPHLGALLPDPELNVVVGLAVQPVTFAAIRTAFGNPALATAPPDQDALEFELQFTSGVALDILTSREPGGEGAIARFLAKFGEAVQQVEFPLPSRRRSRGISENEVCSRAALSSEAARRQRYADQFFPGDQRFAGGQGKNPHRTL